MQKLKRFLDKPKNQTTEEWIELAEATIDSYFKRLREAQHGVKWLPIETAPKDGTSVLLCWAVNADGKMIDWQKNSKTAQVFVQVAAWWDGDNAWIVYCDQIKEPALHFNPTHWMPLPPPPTV